MMIAARAFMKIKREPLKRMPAGQWEVIRFLRDHFAGHGAQGDLAGHDPTFPSSLG